MQLSLFILLFLTWSCVTSDDEHKIELEIYGGTVSKPNKWPFMATISINLGYGNILCGGVVWNEDTILTAAHCVKKKPSLKPDRLRVLLGHSNIDSYDSKYIFKVKQFHVHEQYSIFTNQNDIAVLKLASKIDFPSDRIRCVCEPEPLVHTDWKRCIALGWGKTEENTPISKDLREVELPITPDKRCYHSMDLKKQFCAGGSIAGRGTCFGDSGGPLVCPLLNDSTVYTLVGIASYGAKKCGTEGMPTVFTKVHHYLSWIAKYADED